MSSGKINKYAQSKRNSDKHTKLGLCKYCSNEAARRAYCVYHTKRNNLINLKNRYKRRMIEIEYQLANMKVKK